MEIDVLSALLWLLVGSTAIFTLIGFVLIVEILKRVMKDSEDGDDTT